MGVKYEYVDKILKKNGLKKTKLKFLVPDERHYTTMLYQHQGDLEVSFENGKAIRNANQELAMKKHVSFLKLVLDKNADLAVTPEYSCPINAIYNFLDSSDLKKHEGLMAIGCESMTSTELLRFKEHFNNDDLIVLMEEIVNKNEKRFFDPILYLFNTRRKSDSELVTVALFQFKTYPMGATPIESEFMAFGKKRYVIRNNDTSIYLATIVCSESLNINMSEDLKQFHDKPYLILHPQLNNSPRTESFKNYRSHYFVNCPEDAHVDILCYNWARGSKIQETPLYYSHSALYTKAKKIIIDDERIDKNDKLGLYYNIWKNAKASILIFDDREAVFCFRNHKVSKRTINIQNQSRYGPEMECRLVWADTWIENISDLEDVKKICENIGGNFEYFLRDDMPYLNRERLLGMTVGIQSDPGWISPDKNSLFNIANNEYSFRIHVLQDPDTKDQKVEWLTRFAAFSTKFACSSDWIPNDGYLNDLHNNREINYSAQLLNYNLLGSSGIPACLIYAGDSYPAKIEELRSVMLKSSPKDNTYSQRMIIIYNYLGEVRINYEREAPSFTKNNNYNPTAINKKTEPWKD